MFTTCSLAPLLFLVHISKFAPSLPPAYPFGAGSLNIRVSSAFLHPVGKLVALSTILTGLSPTNFIPASIACSRLPTLICSAPFSACLIILFTLYSRAARISPCAASVCPIFRSNAPLMIGRITDPLVMDALNELNFSPVSAFRPKTDSAMSIASPVIGAVRINAYQTNLGLVMIPGSIALICGPYIPRK